jgi:hypothetical protein
VYRRADTGLGFSLTDFISNVTRSITGVATTASQAATDLSRIRIPSRSAPAAAPDTLPAPIAPSMPSWVVPAGIAAVALLFLSQRRR